GLVPLPRLERRHALQRGPLGALYGAARLALALDDERLRGDGAAAAAPAAGRRGSAARARRGGPAAPRDAADAAADADLVGLEYRRARLVDEVQQRVVGAQERVVGDGLEEVLEQLRPLAREVPTVLG